MDITNRYRNASRRIALAVSLTLALLLVGSPQAAARTWVDSTGEYAVKANFVRMDGDTVELQRNDSQLIRIPLSKLSVLDGELAKLLSQQPGRTFDVVTEGAGLTSQEALDDAFRRASDMAGAMVDAETTIQKDEVVKDRVLIFSDGYVTKHEIIETRYDKGLCYRKIRATVQRRELVSRPAGATVDASNLYAEAYTKLRRRQIGLSMIQTEIDRFGGDMLHSKSVVLDHPEVIPGTKDQVRIPFDVTITVDHERYAKTRRHLIYVLEALAKYSGSIDSGLRRFGQQSQTAESLLQYDIFSRWMRKRFASMGVAGKGLGDPSLTFDCVEQIINPQVTGRLPENIKTYVPSEPSTLFVVNDGDDGLSNSTWRWFEVDARFSIPVVQTILAIRYLDGDKEPVRSERLELGPSIPGLSVGLPSENLQSMLFGPFFVCHVGKGYYSMTATMARTLSLRGQALFRLAELAPVKSVDAAITSENPMGRIFLNSEDSAPDQEYPTEGTKQPQIPSNHTDVPGKGLEVVKVLPGGEAEASGVYVGDIIVRYAGQRTTNVQDLLRAIKNPEGKSRELIILRAGKEIGLRVAPGHLRVQVKEIPIESPK